MMSSYRSRFLRVLESANTVRLPGLNKRRRRAFSKEMRWKTEARAMAVRVRRILSGKRKSRFDTPGLGVALIALLVTVLLYVGSAASGRLGSAGLIHKSTG
jgi:hypothetical protein